MIIEPKIIIEFSETNPFKVTLKNDTPDPDLYTTWTWYIDKEIYGPDRSVYTRLPYGFSTMGVHKVGLMLGFNEERGEVYRWVDLDTKTVYTSEPPAPEPEPPAPEPEPPTPEPDAKDDLIKAILEMVGMFLDELSKAEGNKRTSFLKGLVLGAGLGVAGTYLYMAGMIF